MSGLFQPCLPCRVGEHANCTRSHCYCLQHDDHPLSDEALDKVLADVWSGRRRAERNQP